MPVIGTEGEGGGVIVACAMQRILSMSSEAWPIAAYLVALTGSV